MLACADKDWRRTAGQTAALPSSSTPQHHSPIPDTSAAPRPSLPHPLSHRLFPCRREVVALVLRSVRSQLPGLAHTAIILLIQMTEAFGWVGAQLCLLGLAESVFPQWQCMCLPLLEQIPHFIYYPPLRPTPAAGMRWCHTSRTAATQRSRQCCSCCSRLPAALAPRRLWWTGRSWRSGARVCGVLPGA